MVNRRGAGKLGCLLTLLFVAAGSYFGARVGEVYWNFYNYRDTMAAQARFAESFTDDQIRKRLIAKADSLGLPPDASEITIERKGRHISIAADYAELVELPLHVRTFRFSPRAEHDY
jgi:hypothetical protein